MGPSTGKWGHPRGTTGWYGFAAKSLKSTTCRFPSAQSYRPNAFFANNENFLLQNTLMYEGQYRTLSGTSRGVADFNFQTLAERDECGLDLIEPRLVPERQQTFDVSLRYADAARELGFLQP